MDHFKFCSRLEKEKGFGCKSPQSVRDFFSELDSRLQGFTEIDISYPEAACSVKMIDRFWLSVDGRIMVLSTCEMIIPFSRRFAGP